MQKIKIVMMKIDIRKTRVLRSIRKQTMEGLPRAEISIQKRTTTHLMMAQIVKMILKRVIFLAMDAKEVTVDHDESKEEGEVNLEAKLINALKELHKERKKIKLLEKELGQVKERT